MQIFCRTLLSSSCSLCAGIFFAATHLSLCLLEYVILGAPGPKLSTNWCKSFALIRAVIRSFVKVSEDLQMRLDSRSRDSISEITSFRSSLSFDSDFNSAGALCMDLTTFARLPEAESRVITLAAIPTGSMAMACTSRSADYLAC